MILIIVGRLDAQDFTVVSEEKEQHRHARALKGKRLKQALVKPPNTEHVL